MAAAEGAGTAGDTPAAPQGPLDACHLRRIPTLLLWVRGTAGNPFTTARDQAEVRGCRYSILSHG